VSHDGSGVRRKVEPEGDLEWRFYSRLLFQLTAYKMQRDGVDHAVAKSWAQPFVDQQLKLQRSRTKVSGLRSAWETARREEAR